MEFRDLHRQYEVLKQKIDRAVAEVVQSGNYISGLPVLKLEAQLAEFTGRKHCITCGNGTDALVLALKAIGVKAGDAVFVPDFTFFASGEAVAAAGATPVFVDVEEDTFNISPNALEDAVVRVTAGGVYQAKAVIAVDLFGQPADYEKITKLAEKYGLSVIEDGAQGFGGGIGDAKACSFGDISTTSFFPAKPFGCYGDGGAVFTDCDEWNQVIRSLCVHGKSPEDKYDNIRIGMNSRLDSIQAAILLAKFEAFQQKELRLIEEAAKIYTEELKDVVKTPYIKSGYSSSWAQYTIRFKSAEERKAVEEAMALAQIPCMVYYRKPLHKQKAFSDGRCLHGENKISLCLSETVLSLPISPYIRKEEVRQVTERIRKTLQENEKRDG